MLHLTTFLIALYFVNISYSRHVETLLGPVQGNRVDTLDPRTNLPISYDEFLTIPFAEPPVGQLRFAPPKPAQPWEQPNTNVPFQRVCYQVYSLET